MFAWDHGLVTFSEVDADGFIGLQVDVPGEKRAGVASGEPGSPLGFFGRPHDPELDDEGEPNPVKACGALYAYYGDRLHVWAQTDPRELATLPRVKKGGRVFHGGKLGQQSFLHIDGDSGALDGYFPYAFNSADPPVPAKAMVVAVDTRSSGTESIGLVHGDGMAFTLVAGGKNSGTWKNKAGDAYVELNDDGIILNGNLKSTGAATFGSATAAMPVALAAQVIAYMTALETLLTALATAIDAKTVPSPGVSLGVVNTFIGLNAATKTAIAATLVKGL